jgi:ABC-2 type transport system ATP-binding protein
MYFFEALNISKTYSNHKALDDVSLQIQEGAIYGLLGPNGAGKTSMIRIINQITGADKGKLLWKGKPMIREHVNYIGYLPEERGLYKKMKVGEHGLYLAQLKGVPYKIAKEKLHFWFEKFQIMEWWNKRIEELSKGMQQKIQFILTVIHEPQMFIFDEPFSGFDPINTELLKKEILNFKKQGASIILSTHNMASVEELCDDMLLIINRKQFCKVM